MCGVTSQRQQQNIKKSSSSWCYPNSCAWKDRERGERERERRKKIGKIAGLFFSFFTRRLHRRATHVDLNSEIASSCSFPAITSSRRIRMWKSATSSIHIHKKRKKCGFVVRKKGKEKSPTSNNDVVWVLNLFFPLEKKKKAGGEEKGIRETGYIAKHERHDLMEGKVHVKRQLLETTGRKKSKSNELWTNRAEIGIWVLCFVSSLYFSAPFWEPKAFPAIEVLFPSLSSPFDVKLESLEDVRMISSHFYPMERKEHLTMARENIFGLEIFVVRETGFFQIPKEGTKCEGSSLKKCSFRHVTWRRCWHWGPEKKGRMIPWKFLCHFVSFCFLSRC